MSSIVSEDDLKKITKLLGREPRGLEAVQVRNANNEPSVIRVSSLVDGDPFPTLFWLVDAKINYWLDGLESSGVIGELQSVIDTDTTMQQALRDDHLSYCEMRKSFMSKKVEKALKLYGFYDQLVSRGIGGIANFSRIRCLHTYYAAHLVNNNTVGCLLDDTKM